MLFRFLYYYYYSARGKKYLYWFDSCLTCVLLTCDWVRDLIVSVMLGGARRDPISCYDSLGKLKTWSTLSISRLFLCERKVKNVTKDISLLSRKIYIIFFPCTFTLFFIIIIRLLLILWLRYKPIRIFYLFIEFEIKRDDARCCIYIFTKISVGTSHWKAF